MRFFQPILAGAHLPERIVACLGAAIGIAVTMMVCALAPRGGSDLPIIVAPLGASAVLVFAVPASPLAQPWPVIGGNVVSTLVGVAAFTLVRDPVVAAALGVGAAILVMSLLRCLHPPGGAAALTAVIGSQSIHDAGFGFALLPVGINSVALVALGIAFHRATRRSYPHRPSPAPPLPSGLHLADIDAALDDMHESFDISRDDLDALLTRAEWYADARRRG
ncbi:HPP family protein [Sphingomonas sp. TZW2008]|uniref:HPP family protein n=1 Tax=Sphingomonas sp. TZW2008 TaxID=1917973 RepID=UPI001181ADBA|nr:HPP family protein [Sphingomonas sp. TZW2008]